MTDSAAGVEGEKIQPEAMCFVAGLESKEIGRGGRRLRSGVDSVFKIEAVTLCPAFLPTLGAM